MCSLNSDCKQTKYCSRPHYNASICGRYKNTTVLWHCKPTLKADACTTHCDDHDNDGDDDGGDDDWSAFQAILSVMHPNLFDSLDDFAFARHCPLSTSSP